MDNLTGKTVNLNLVGMDGNALVLIANFQKQARREGWTKEEIELVAKEAQSGDYDHLLSVLLAHSNVDEFEPELEDDEDDEDDERYSEFSGAY